MSAAAYPKGPREDIPALIKKGVADGVLAPKELEEQTDKPMVKLVPCTNPECRRPIAVNVFYAPAIAKCSDCGFQAKSAGTGQSQIVQAGRTDPEKAARLDECLVNKEFAGPFMCPLCEHAMELKYVTHNPSYGPRKLIGHDSKGPLYKETLGESAMLQCNKCLTTLSLSTMHQVEYRRQNEPKQSTRTSTAWETLLGEREAS